MIIMSTYLESYLEKNPTSKYLFTPDEDDEAPKRLKNTFASRLRTVVWKKKEFKDLADELCDDENRGVGTHSGRKYPAEFATNCGCNYNEVEIRGRWKGQKGGRVVFRYINIQQLYEDAKVAATICIGGPVKYVIKDGITGLTREWLFEHVVPAIRRRFPNDSRLCTVLALALLYICLGDNEVVFVPPEVKSRVRAAYAQLGLEEAQPIKKVPLHVYRNNGVLMIDALDEDGSPSGGAGPGGGGGSRMSNEMGQTLLVRMNQVERTQAQTQVQFMGGMADLRTYCGGQFRLLNNNIRCYGGTIQGSLVRQRASNREHRLLREGEANEAPELTEVRPAILSNNPRSLILLWREYQFGIDGKKAAKLWDRNEINSSNTTKQKYWRRNHVWQAIARLVRGGRTAELAAIEIKKVYGFASSVSKIIKEMIKDRHRHPGGIHPNLR